MSDYFGISIDEIHCGGATVSLLTVPKSIRITGA